MLNQLFQRFSKEEHLEISDARFFTGGMAFLSPSSSVSVKCKSAQRDANTVRRL